MLSPTRALLPLGALTALACSDDGALAQDADTYPSATGAAMAAHESSDTDGSDLGSDAGPESMGSSAAEPGQTSLVARPSADSGDADPASDEVVDGTDLAMVEGSGAQSAESESDDPRPTQAEGDDPRTPEDGAEGADDGSSLEDLAANTAEDGEALEPSDGAESGFDIELVFDIDGELDPIVREAFEAARVRWQEVIVGDLVDYESRVTRQCDGFEIPEVVDDLIIFVTLESIDGPNGILGAAGPCMIRGEGAPLPFAGRMQFDTDDLLGFAEQGRLEEIVLHEMGHVLGIGALWQPLELLDDPASGQRDVADTAFTGSLAIERFEAAGGNAYDGAKVPVENSGGDGVANGHWRESVLGNELMTPFLSNLPGLLSEVTIASLQDVGYEVSYDAADAYSWPPEEEPRFAAAGVVGGSAQVSLHDDILRIPIYAVDADGAERRLR